MSELVTCPHCKKNVEVDGTPGDVSGSAFCSNCGRPLFWAAIARAGLQSGSIGENGAPLVPPGEVDGARPHASGTPVVAGGTVVSVGDDRQFRSAGRFPEVEGIRNDEYLECWRCSERNVAGVVECRLCEAAIPRPEMEDEPDEGGEACAGVDGAQPWIFPTPKAWLLVTLAIAVAVLAVIFVLAVTGVIAAGHSGGGTGSSATVGVTANAGPTTPMTVA